MTNEYIRREDAVDALADYIMNVDKVYSTGKLTQDDCIDCAESVLNDLSSADVAPVVRCRDCRYNTSIHKCLNPDSFFLVPDDNDFCSYGERREEQNE